MEEYARKLDVEKQNEFRTYDVNPDAPDADEDLEDHKQILGDLSKTEDVEDEV